MKGSVIKRMYAGFLVIVIMFIVTITIMLGGINDIHSKFSTVTQQSLPLVSLSNQTSVQLLSADKAFKDFLTTQDAARMEQSRSSFSAAQKEYQQISTQLETASKAYPQLSDDIEKLAQLEQQYFSEAQEAMNNYQKMFSNQEQVQQSVRRFQKLTSELNLGMKEYVAGQKSISVKLVAKSYFIKLKDAEIATSDALASSDTAFVKQAVEKNTKAVSHLNYAFNSLLTQVPAIRGKFDDSVAQFTQDIGKPGGVLDQHFAYLTAKNDLYTNIQNLATKIDNGMVLLNEFNNVATGELEQSLEQAETIYNNGMLEAIILGVVVIILASGIGYHIAHSVRSPLARIFETLEALAGGDMTKRIDNKYNNEFGLVSDHINSLANNLHQILVKLNDASVNLTAAASDNQNTSNDAQSKLNNQREQTANVATAMTEMEHSVAEVTQSAQSSLEKVRQVEKASDTGRQVMNQNITTINQLEGRLNESVVAVSQLKNMSSEIGSILDVIRGIAEQTNLLALNAAIEAARAGEQGRGFAVVADEVRVLAQKTTESTEEIEGMINNLQSSSQTAGTVIESCMSDMEQSVAQASDANSSMEEIQALILEISHMSSHISQAALEQSETTSDIARSLEDINHIASESHQAMSTIADVSNNMADLAQQQDNLVHQFKL
ncbi:methyl-accepting chemotaxis protein [Vibrio sp. MACH09]|uniref:methyl-accepting chemotaxis protein n=1 Tax=unclassified Vibrio TaxID=2614977 RepID=UPI001493C4CD|nr:MULTISPECIES: methyl-accepting chemotaxis protein [unclassified Vibrio]NOI67576.1 methyl-accepting chemotaxis protein [Vibrio sp. 99-8-1]GLO61289.1 methyl-accepting chemotaxis protein [Vibrio sp. MACH09]